MPLPDHGRDDLARWLRLVLTPGLGPAKLRGLRAAFGFPENGLATDRRRLAEILGPERAEALARPDPARDAAVDAALAWASEAGHHLVALTDPAYPPRLREIPDPPWLLFVHGDPARLSAPSVAIVGSRSASRSGLDNAHAFARALGDAGQAVVSGLAVGIDGAAHGGALDTPGGTVAVLGTGIDRIYPARHRALAAEIVARGGAIVSEVALGTPPLKQNFPLRNRLIAGFAHGVLVVEAAPRSGSLITARLAAEFGREVFAVPGSIHSPLARGCHALIRQGATLVETAADVLAELPGRTWAAPFGALAVATAAAGAGPTAAAGRSAEPPDPILDALGWDPLDLERLAARLDDRGPASAGRLAARLVALELDGRLERLPDGRFQRRHPP